MLIFYSRAIETWKIKDENKGLVLAALELASVTLPKKQISHLEKTLLYLSALL